MGSIYLAWSLYLLVTFFLPFPTECHFCLGRRVLGEGGIPKKKKMKYAGVLTYKGPTYTMHGVET